MVHVLQVRVAHTFDILAEGDGLTNVLVLVSIVRENGIIDHHAVDFIVLVGLDDLLLQILLIDCAKIKLEPANDLSDHCDFLHMGEGRAYFSSQVFLEYSA